MIKPKVARLSNARLCQNCFLFPYFLHLVFQICRDITQPVIKPELRHLHQNVFYHQAYIKENFNMCIYIRIILTTYTQS